MHNVQIGQQTYKIPAEWGELTIQQLRHLAVITQQPANYCRIETLMLLHIMGARVLAKSEGNDYQLRTKKGTFYITATQWQELANLLGFLFSENESEEQDSTINLAPALTENPLPTITAHGGGKLHAPEDATLSTLTFNQYSYLATYLSRTKEDETATAKALATVWTSSEKFNHDTHQKDTERITKLPKTTQTIMMWFISSALATLAQLFPRVFATNNAKPTRQNVLDSQLRLLDALASSDITKKEQIRNAPLIDALYTMDERIKQKEQEEQKQ